MSKKLKRNHKPRDKNAAVKKKVRSFMEDLEFFVGIHNYDKTIVWPKENEDNTAAHILVDEKYQRVVLTIFPRFFDEGKREQAEMLVHEFVHALIAPLQHEAEEMSDGNLVTRKQVRYSVERVTSSVTEIMVRLLSGRMKYMKKAFLKYQQ